MYGECWWARTLSLDRDGSRDLVMQQASPSERRWCWTRKEGGCQWSSTPAEMHGSEHPGDEWADYSFSACLPKVHTAEMATSKDWSSAEAPRKDSFSFKMLCLGSLQWSKASDYHDTEPRAFSLLFCLLWMYSPETRPKQSYMTGTPRKTAVSMTVTSQVTCLPHHLVCKFSQGYSGVPAIPGSFWRSTPTTGCIL